MDDLKTSEETREETSSGGRFLIGWALIAAGALFMLLGWWGVSGQPIVAAQLSYVVSGGLGGLLAGIAGVGLLVSNDIRRDRERLGRVEAAMLEIRAMLVAQSRAAEDGAQRNGQRGSLRGPADAPTEIETGRATDIGDPTSVL